MYEHEAEAAQRRSNSKRVEFDPPNGFTMPEGSEEKGEFDSVCTFHVKPDGKLCLVMLGDHKMPGYDKEEERESRTAPDYKEMAGSMVNEMEGQTNPQSY